MEDNQYTHVIDYSSVDKDLPIIRLNCLIKKEQQDRNQKNMFVISNTADIENLLRVAEYFYNNIFDYNNYLTIFKKNSVPEKQSILMIRHEKVNNATVLAVMEYDNRIIVLRKKEDFFQLRQAFESIRPELMLKKQGSNFLNLGDAIENFIPESKVVVNHIIDEKTEPDENLANSEEIFQEMFNTITTKNPFGADDQELSMLSDQNKGLQDKQQAISQLYEEYDQTMQNLQKKVIQLEKNGDDQSYEKFLNDTDIVFNKENTVLKLENSELKTQVEKSGQQQKVLQSQISEVEMTLESKKNEVLFFKEENENLRMNLDAKLVAYKQKLEDESKLKQEVESEKQISIQEKVFNKALKFQISKLIKEKMELENSSELKNVKERLKSAQATVTKQTNKLHDASDQDQEAQQKIVDLETRVFDLEKLNSELDSENKLRDEANVILQQSNMDFFGNGQQNNTVTTNNFGNITGDLIGDISQINPVLINTNMNYTNNIDNAPTNFNDMNNVNTRTNTEESKNDNKNFFPDMDDAPNRGMEYPGERDSIFLKEKIPVPVIPAENNVPKKKQDEKDRLIEYHPSGLLARRVSLRNNQFNGIYTEFFQNETPKLTCFYSNGVLTGFFEENYESGEPKSRLNFENGLKDGFCTFYRPNSSIEFEGTYKKGVAEGEGKTYFNNYMMEFEGIYQKNLRNGQGTLYNDNGGILYRGNWSNGNKTK